MPSCTLCMPIDSISRSQDTLPWLIFDDISKLLAPPVVHQCTWHTPSGVTRWSYVSTYFNELSWFSIDSMWVHLHFADFNGCTSTGSCTWSSDLCAFLCEIHSICESHHVSLDVDVFLCNAIAVHDFWYLLALWTIRTPLDYPHPTWCSWDFHVVGGHQFVMQT